MENVFSNEPAPQGLELTSESIAFLSETSKWAKFLAILGFIGLLFLIIFGLSFGAIFGNLAKVNPAFPSNFPIGGLGIVYVILAVILAFPVYYLYQFSVKTQAAIASTDTPTLTRSLGYLKSYYKFVGIFTIVILAIYILIIIIGIIAGATMFSRLH